MKTFIISVAFILSYGLVYAGGVTDDNNGNAGDILVSTGENHGADSVGTWTNPSFLQGATGATGAQGPIGLTGATGPQGPVGPEGPIGPMGPSGTNGVDGGLGPQGPKGDTGAQGPQGPIGLTGAMGPQGTPGTPGTNGENGVNGANGTNGSNGANGTNGANGHTPVKGVDYFDGLNGINGTNGKDVDPATVNRLDNRIDQTNRRVRNLEKTQYDIRGEVIVQQGRREKVGVYGKYDVTRHTVSEVGLSITIALDDSYEMKEIDKLNEKIARLNWLLDKGHIETETVKEGNKTIIRIKQKEGVIALMNRF